MLAGNPAKRSYNESDPAQKAISHVCLHPDGTAPETPGFPAGNCPYGLRTQVFFPSYVHRLLPWLHLTHRAGAGTARCALLADIGERADCAQDLDSADRKSHVAYPDGVNTGKCPPSHPVHLISIFYELVWDVNSWADEWWSADGLGHPLTLSNGDPTG